MNLRKQNIMFLTRTMALGGTENVILQLCETFKDKVNKIIVCSSGGINVKVLQEMGIKHYQITDIENKNPINIIRTVNKIKKIIKEENITIIHSHHRMAALYSNICSNKSIIKIANAHNTFNNKKIMTRICYKNTHIIAVGEQVKSNLSDFFKIDKNKVTVIHNAIKEFDGKVIEEKEFTSKKQEGFKLIANVGRLSEQKGMEYFIKAAKIVNENNKKVMFYIIGSGEDEKKLKELVHQLKLDDFVVFMGFRKDIQSLLSQVDFVVLSSLWEGLPLTPIEAFSVGKTIIATAVDGTPEIVINNKNGYLVKPRNEKEIADKIKYLIQNPNKVKELEEKSEETYKEKFSFEKLQKEYLSFYMKLEDKYEKSI